MEKANDSRNICQSVMVEISIIESGRISIVSSDAMASNVSSEGMDVFTDHTLGKGNIVKVLFPIDDGSVKIPVFTDVIWVEISDGKYRAGLRFLG